MSEDCVFCREIGGSRLTNFGRLYPEIPSRVIGETDSLIAFPCIGQLTKGHFLIVPRKHECTFGVAVSRKSSLADEFHLISRQVHMNLGFAEHDSLFFEHGALNPVNGGCGIYHAHIHVVPGVGNVNPQDVFDFNGEQPHDRLESAWQVMPIQGAYVMVGTASEGFFLRAIDEPLESQTLRKSVARILGMDTWDWRKASRESSMIEVLAEASS